LLQTPESIEYLADPHYHQFWKQLWLKANDILSHIWISEVTTKNNSPLTNCMRIPFWAKLSKTTLSQSFRKSEYSKMPVAATAPKDQIRLTNEIIANCWGKWSDGHPIGNTSIGKSNAAV
jgi:hypothetical protein